MMNAKLTLRAPAKINLQLAVGAPTPTGLHQILTLICPISLYDEFEIILAEKATQLDSSRGVEQVCFFSTELQQHINASVTKYPQIAVDAARLGNRENLVSRATAAILQGERFATRLASSGGLWPVKISATKGIPFLAGLGGGSSDAALILQILKFLLRLELSSEELYETGSQFGSDIPAALAGCPVVVWGCGEKLLPLRGECFAQLQRLLGGLHVVLLKPTQGVRTAEAYSLFDQARAERGGNYAVLNPEELLERCRRIARIKDSVSTVQCLADAGLIGNDFDCCVSEAFAEIKVAHQLLKEAGATQTQLSGSGSTVFSLCDTESAAQAIVSRLEQLAPAGWFFKRARIVTEAFPWS